MDLFEVRHLIFLANLESDMYVSRRTFIMQMMYTHSACVQLNTLL
jgi:hypothetical protein